MLQHWAEFIRCMYFLLQFCYAFIFTVGILEIIMLFSWAEMSLHSVSISLCLKLDMVNLDVALDLEYQMVVFQLCAFS